MGKLKLSPFPLPSLPADGPLELDFAEPPVVTSLADGEHYSPGDVLEWELNDVDAADPDLVPSLLIVTSTGDRQLFGVTFPAGTTSGVVPTLPSDVRYLGSYAVAYVQLVEQNHDGTSYDWRYASGPTILVDL